MHIHPNLMTPSNTGIHSAAAAEKASSAQRAADTRRRLLKNAAQIDGMPDVGERFMIGSWAEGHSGGREKRSSNEQQKGRPDDEGSGATPISVWA